jgi:GTP-binding protein HflX
VREVFNELDVRDLPELIVINKADLADPVVLARLRLREPGAIVVSARTGAGFDELREAIAVRLPHPPVRVDVLVPYSRGDLVARMHEVGEIDDLEHGADGTRVAGRVPPDLAADLAPYAVAGQVDGRVDG